MSPFFTAFFTAGLPLFLMSSVAPLNVNMVVVVSGHKCMKVLIVLRRMFHHQVIVREEQAVIHNEALKAQGERSKS